MTFTKGGKRQSTRGSSVSVKASASETDRNESLVMIKEEGPSPRVKPDDTEMARNCRIASAEFKEGQGKRDTSFSFTSPMIEVTVGKGPHSKKFTIHQDLFTKTSKVFFKAQQAAVKSAGDDSVKFPDLPPKVFEHVLQWMYNSTIRDMSYTGTDQTTCLINLYAMASFLSITSLKNDVLDRIMLDACNNHAVPMGHLPQAYEVTTKDSPLRKLLIDLAVHEVDACHYASFDLSAEIWRDLAATLKQLYTDEIVAPFEAGLKEYYEK